jgi:hypothetical protein
MEENSGMSTQATITEILPRAEQAIKHLAQIAASLPPEQTGPPFLAGFLFRQIKRGARITLVFIYCLLYII